MAKFHGSIPMRPYLHKFVLSLENKNDDDVIVLTENTLIARTLKLFLTGKSQLEKRADMKSISEQYSTSLRFEINYRALDQGKIFMPAKTVVTFNNFIYTLFHETLLQRILFGYRYGLDEIKIIENFLKEHGIEPDIDIQLHSVKKTSYRLREKKKIPNFYTEANRALKLTDNQSIRVNRAS